MRDPCSGSPPRGQHETTYEQAKAAPSCAELSTEQFTRIAALHPTPHTPHYTPHTTHPTLHTLYYTPYTTHPILHTLHYTPYTTHPTLHTLYYTPYATHPTQNARPRTTPPLRTAHWTSWPCHCGQASVAITVKLFISAHGHLLTTSKLLASRLPDLYSSRCARCPSAPLAQVRLRNRRYRPGAAYTRRKEHSNLGRLH